RHIATYPTEAGRPTPHWIGATCARGLSGVRFTSCPPATTSPAPSPHSHVSHRSGATDSRSGWACDLCPAGLPRGSATGHGAINGRPTRPVCPEKVDSDPGFSCSAGLDAEAEGVVLAVPVGDDLHVVGRATDRAADHDLATPGFLRADRCGLQDHV